LRALEKLGKLPSPICACEKEREAQLWGDQPLKVSKQLALGTRRAENQVNANDVDIQVKIIE